MQLTEPTDSKDSGYRLQEFIEFALNVTLWWCKWAIHKGIAFKCFALRHVFVVSDLIRPVALPPRGTTKQFVGAIARVSGFGLTSQRVLTHSIHTAQIKNYYYTVSATWI
jgi:hypothetical protein